MSLRTPTALVACALAVTAASVSTGGRAANLAGCRRATGGALTLSVGGRTRTIDVHVPNGIGTKPVPLVLNLHGSGSDAAQQERFSGMDATADADGFVVAYPQAAIPASGGFDWDVPGEPLSGGAAVPAGAPDDISFLHTVVGVLGQRYCIDRARVYVVGFSGGGRMASQAGCDLSTTFAAVAAVSGLRFPSPCRGKRPVPVLAVHGTADPVDPYGGRGQAYWTYSVPEAADLWAAHDGCRPKPVVTKPAASVRSTAYGRCRGGAEVVLVAIAGAGHTWPGGPPLPARILRLLGPQSHAVDADTLLWRFFSAHRLR